MYSYQQDDNLYSPLEFKIRKLIEERLDSVGLLSSFSFLRPGPLAEILMWNPCADFSEIAFLLQESRIRLLGADVGAPHVGLEPFFAVEYFLNEPTNKEITFAVIETYAGYLSQTQFREFHALRMALYLEGRVGEMKALNDIWITSVFGGEKGRQLLETVGGHLIADRNAGFVKTALPEISQGGAVIAVDAFHLPGRSGLVAMFREAGHSVERVSVTGEY